MDLALAHTIIDLALRAGPTEPRLMCSFGKDSLVMIDLLAEHGMNRVLFIEDNDEIVDYDFNERVIETYDLDVVHAAPGRGVFLVVKDQPLYLAWSFVSRHHTTPIPTNITPYEGQTKWVSIPNTAQSLDDTKVVSIPWVCMTDKLSDPDRWATTPLDTDYIFTGFKLADIDAKACLTFVNLLSEPAIAAYKVGLQETGPFFSLAPGLPACAPLMDWTDHDVWEYIHAHDVPWSRQVYTDDGRRRPHQHVCCFRCHDPRESSIVTCPKTGAGVLNPAALMQDTDLKLQQLARMGVMTQAQITELTHAS